MSITDFTELNENAQTPNIISMSIDQPVVRCHIAECRRKGSGIAGDDGCGISQ